ncbi:MAG: hypothetical protein KC646_09855 [Candidatus Cloacimonetes bacterium]|nr:hypothetical protein [Candidatus Cloacimonadota bacterium]
MNKNIKLVTIILLLVIQNMWSAPLGRSTRYGDILITEVQLDNDGVTTAIPYHGSTGGVEDVANSKTVKSDVVIEVYNNSGVSFDLNNLAILYLVETREGTLPVLNGSSTDLLYDICGLQDNTGDGDVANYLTLLGWTVTGAINLSLKNFDGLASPLLAASEVVAIYDQPKMADTSVTPTTADLMQRATTAYTGTGGEIHTWPVLHNLASIPTYGTSTFPIVATHHRLFSGGLDNIDGGDGALPGMAGGNDVVEVNQYFGRDTFPRLSADRLTPRLCLGNSWTPETEYTTPFGGAAVAVDSWNFTIVLIDTANNGILDVFSLGRAASAQAHINTDGMISSGDFNFTPSGVILPTVGTAPYCVGPAGRCELDDISYIKTTFSPASSRASYVLTSVPTIGTVGDVVPPDPLDNGTADFLSSTNLELLIKRPPISGNTLEPGFNGKVGDPDSTFSIKFQGIHNNSGTIQSVSYQIATTDPVTPTFFPTAGPVALAYNSGTNKFEGEFSPLSLRLGFVDSQDYQIRVFATDNLGATDNEYVGDSIAFTAVRSSPIVNEFVATISNPVKVGDIIPISVDVADEGTAALKHIKVSLVSTIDGGFVPVQETFTLPAFNDTPYVGKPPNLKPKYFHNFTVPSSVKTDGTTYHFQLDIADGFFTNDARQESTTIYSSPNFAVETAPRLDTSLIGGHPVNLVVDTSTVIDIRNAIEYNGTIGPLDTGIVLDSKTANIAACSLDPAPTGATQLTITAGSVAGTGFCTFTMTTVDAKVGTGTIEITILPSADTFVNSFRIAPSLTPSITPTGFTSQSKASWSDILEFEANVSDIDGVKSVQMNFVLTESGFQSGGVPVPPDTVIYSIYLYDDFTDKRTPSSLPNAGGPIPFGTTVLGGDNFYSYDTNLSDGNPSAVHETKGQNSVGPSNGTMDRFPASTVGERHLISYEADLSASGDNLWHISVAPVKFQFPTHYRLDLVLEDNSLNVTNVPNVGGVSVFTGPGYDPLTQANNAAFLGTESATAVNKVITLSSFECTAPEGVAGRKCGAALTTQEHAELVWSVVNFDTNFYSNVAITNTVQDEITYSLLPHACTSNSAGVVNLAVSDGVVNTTTSEYTLDISCVNDAPVFHSDYALGGARPTINVPEESKPATISILNFADEVILGMGEDPQSSLIWSVQTGVGTSGVHPNISAYSVSGNNLLVTPVPNFSHPGSTFDTIVLCAQDTQGAFPTNGDVPRDGGLGTCITIPIGVVPSDDNPTISTNGIVAGPKIADVTMNEDDAPQTFQIGYFDVDGPFPTNPWKITEIGPQPSSPAVGVSPISTIELSVGAMVGTSGQLWDMKVTLKPEHYGVYEYLFSVDNGGSLSDTQLVTFTVNQVNDPPFFNANLCGNGFITLDSTDSVSAGGIATKQFPFNFPTIKWDDIDLTKFPEQSENLRLILKSVDYTGVKFSQAQSAKVTVSGVETLSNFGTQSTTFTVPATDPLFNVNMINNSTGLIEVGAINDAAVENATFHFVVQDRNGASPFLESGEDVTCVLKVRDNGTPNIGSTPGQIASAIGNIYEDSTTTVDMGVFEANNYNFFGGPLDSDLQWSVRLTAGLSMFDNTVDYPDFKGYLLDQNIKSKVNCLTNLSGADKGISSQCVPSTINGTPINLSQSDVNNDTLFIHPAPDVFGDFTLEFTLSNESCTGQITCTTTTSVNLTILPVADPPEITIRKLLEPDKDDTAYVIQLPDDGSVLKINTTTWENYSRDFIKPVTGNPVGQFWNDNPFLQSKDLAIYHLGHGSCNTHFEDYANNDNLCIYADANASVTGGASSIDMVLHNGSFEVTRTINIDVGLVNHPPAIVFLDTGIIVTEDIPLNKSLNANGDDREDELAGVESTMSWYFGTSLPAVVDRVFPISEMTARVGPTSISTQTPLFSSVTLNQSSNLLSMIPIENATGVDSLVFVLCDVDSGQTGERLCITTDIGLQITAVDDTPILSDIVTQSIFQTNFVTNEGLCKSIDLSTIVSDIENDAMKYTMVSTSIVDFNTSLFKYPIVTIENNFLNLRPFGYDQSCNNTQNLTASERAFGVVSFVLKIEEIADSTKSVEFSHEVTWLDVPMAPSICPTGQSPLGTICNFGNFHVDGPVSAATLTALEDQDALVWSLEHHESETSSWVLEDKDWKYGETINDYSWAFVSAGNQRVLTYETSVYKMEILTGALDIKDQIRFSVKTNMYTTISASVAPSEVVSLEVMDSKGLKSVHKILVQVIEVNDNPVWANTSFDTHLKPTEEDLFGPIDMNTLANDQFDPNPMLTFRMVDIDKTGQASQCSQSGTTNSDTGLVTSYDKFLATIDPSGNFFVTGKLNRNHFEESASIPSFDIVTFQITDVQGGCIFQEFKIELQELDDIPIIVKPNPLQVHSYVLAEGGSGVTTDIDANDAIDYNPTWDSTRDSTGVIDGYLTFTVNRTDGTVENSIYLVNPDHNTNPKKLNIQLKNPDTYVAGTEQWELILNQSSSTRYGFGRAKSNVTTKINFSMSMVSVDDPPELSLVGNSICIPGASTNQSTCTINSFEDTPFSATLMTSLGFVVTDEESGSGPTIVDHVYSFSPTQVLTSIVKTASSLSNNRQIQFELLNYSSVNSDAQLRANLIPSCSDVQKCDNYGTFEQDIYVLKVVGGVVQNYGVDSKKRFSYIMQSVNDAPYFQNTNFSSIVKQNDGVHNLVHPDILLNTWKADVDATLTDVCYSLPLLSTSKFTASLFSNGNECLNGVCVAPCGSEKLVLRPNLGSLGQASIELRLDDGADGQASKIFSFTIVDTQPRFILGELSTSDLTFTSSTAKHFPVTHFIIDDDPIHAKRFNNEADLDQDPTGGVNGGFWIERVGTTGPDLAGFNISTSGDLVVVPKYTGFINEIIDGMQDYRISYKDVGALDSQTSAISQNVTSRTFTVNVKHGFVEWVRFDDTNGDSTQNSGDRMVVKFSDSSDGVRGVTTNTLSPPTIVPIDSSNLYSLIKAKSGGVNVANMFGNPVGSLVPVVDVGYYNNNFVKVDDPLVNPFSYLQVTYGDTIKNIDRVFIHNGVPSLSNTVPVYGANLIGDALSSKEVTFNQTNDMIPPRFVFANLIDTQSDNLTEFAQGDQIVAHFSESIKLPTGVFIPQNLFQFENVNLGTDPSYELIGNRIIITLGTDAYINTNATIESQKPRMIAEQNMILDKSSLIATPLATYGLSQLLLRDDNMGPNIVDIRYNSRGNSDYETGDQLYIRFSEPVDPTTFIGTGNNDNRFILPQGVSFGTSFLEWKENNTLLILTFGPGASLPNQAQLQTGLKIKLSAVVKDIKGNSAGLGDLTPSLGATLPTSDNVPPIVVFTFEKNGIALDGAALNHVGKGSLLIKAKFDTLQNGVQPVIEISGGGIQTVTSIFSGTGTDFTYLHNIQVDNGIETRDGLRLVSVIESTQDANSNSVVIEGYRSFMVDTVNPVITLDPIGTMQIINGVAKQVVEVESVTMQARSNEILSVAQGLPVFPTNVGVSASLAQDKFGASITLSNLSPGDNSFTLRAIDAAQNQTELQGQVYRVGGDSTGGQNNGNPQDLDNDGVINQEDAFPTNGLEQYDTDGDGKGDNLDLDDDGDGIEDTLDKIVLITNEVLDLSKDSDNDGIPNVFDADMDGDGILNVNELSFVDVYHISGGVLDADNDGIPNYSDPDDDNDNLTDLQELSLIPRSKTWEKDSDGDGILDGAENTIGTRYYAPNSQSYNTWVDAFDSDNDGIINMFDKFPFDSDNDGETNDIDNDSDGDGVLDTVDNFPNDKDNDGIEDKDDEDKDNNLIPDQLEAVVSVTRGECDLINPASQKSCVAVPKVNGKIAFRVPDTGLDQDVTYDMSGLSDEYDGLKNIILSKDPNIIDIVPVVEIKLDQQDMTTDTSKYEVLGKVLHINGKIRPNTQVRFPFVLPSYLVHDNTLKSNDLVLEYYDSGQKKWLKDGSSYQISGGVLYANISHFSNWRVLRDISNVFQNTGTSFASTDGGGGGGGGGCFIVTAASGSKFSKAVQFFTYFRDSFLIKFDSGQKVMNIYYKYSPSIAEAIAQSSLLRLLTNLVLMPFAIVALMFMLWPLSLILIFAFCFYKRAK